MGHRGAYGAPRGIGGRRNRGNKGVGDTEGVGGWRFRRDKGIGHILRGACSGKWHRRA